MIKTETPKRPTHRVYAVTKNGEKSYWTEIGAAWSHQDGKGFNVKLDYLPLNSTALRSSSANPRRTWKAALNDRCHPRNPSLERQLPPLIERRRQAPHDRRR